MRDTTRTPEYSKKLSFTTSTATTTLTNKGKAVVYRLLSTVDCFVDFSGTAVNDGTNMYLVAYTPEYFTSSSVNIAAIGVTSAGDLHITCVGVD